MGSDGTVVYVGTVGQSVWRSLDAGERWSRCSQGLPSESDIRALSLDPRNPTSMLAGTETGLFRSDDGGDIWSAVSSPLDGHRVWSLLRDPRDPATVWAGGSPPILCRSWDGGHSWTRVEAHLPAQCVNGAPLEPRVTCLCLDPADGALFAGVEIGCVRRSFDGGDHWETVGEGLSSPDIHGLAAVWSAGRRTLVATTNNDVNRSEDDGVTWTPLGLARSLPWSYTRALVPDAGDPNILWMGAGNGPPGDEGALCRSRDTGLTWEMLPLPCVTNSTVWSIAVHPSDPRRIYCASISGQLFRTVDGGASWVKLRREFGEVRALAWRPD